MLFSICQLLLVVKCYVCVCVWMWLWAWAWVVQTSFFFLGVVVTTRQKLIDDDTRYFSFVADFRTCICIVIVIVIVIASRTLDMNAWQRQQYGSNSSDILFSVSFTLLSLIDCWRTRTTPVMAGKHGKVPSFSLRNVLLPSVRLDHDRKETEKY